MVVKRMARIGFSIVRLVPHGWTIPGDMEWPICVPFEVDAQVIGSGNE